MAFCATSYLNGYYFDDCAITGTGNVNNCTGWQNKNGTCTNVQHVQLSQKKTRHQTLGHNFTKY